MAKARKAIRPGLPARGSRTGRPIMVALDLLGRRWMLRVLWELRDAHLTFRALQAACDDVSPSSLNQRLRELRDVAVIELDPDRGYGLTPLGRELVTGLVPLVEWSEHWVRVLQKS